MNQRILLINKFYYPRGGDCVVTLNTMLIMTIEKGKTKRNQFKQAIQGIEPNNHISVI